jgi:steroid delta-isomerase-like uncharacterized protein
MAEQDVIKVAQEAVEAFNAGDWQRHKAIHVPDAIYEELATGRRIQGTEQIIQANEGWKEAFPDAKGTITSAFASGNKVALEITWEGTQSGPLAGPAGTLPASNKRVKILAAQVVTVEGGKIKETRHYFDMMGMLQQLGAMPQ